MTDHASRFLDGLAAEAKIERTLLDTPGTSVVGREERAGTGVMVTYWANDRAIVWSDPETIARYDQLADDGRPVDRATVIDLAEAAGLELLADADMRLLGGLVPEIGPLATGYRQHWLTADRDDHVEAVRAFADRSDPIEVEEAALDELDDYDETAINVLTPEATPSDLTTMVAYASACPWDWDPGFGDIGVLIDPTHRGRGLGRWVVANTVAKLDADGLIPLYRHGHHNVGSMTLAASLGFEPVVSLSYFAPRS